MQIKRKMEERRPEKYNRSYLDLGFAVVERGVEQLQSVTCCEVFASECMLPRKLRRHLTANHNYLSGKPCEFFIRKLSETNKQSVVFYNFLRKPAKAQLAAFKVAYRIAKCKKPLSIAEELIFPAAINLVFTMIGEITG